MTVDTRPTAHCIPLVALAETAVVQAVGKLFALFRSGLDHGSTAQFFNMLIVVEPTHGHNGGSQDEANADQAADKLAFLGIKGVKGAIGTAALNEDIEQEQEQQTAYLKAQKLGGFPLPISGAAAADRTDLIVFANGVFAARTQCILSCLVHHKTSPFSS